MGQPVQVATTARPFGMVLKEVEDAVLLTRSAGPAVEGIRDLRWHFDQASAKMNQAIYNDHKDLIHDSTLKTIVTLIEILSRS